MNFEVGKVYLARNGEQVRVVCVDAPCELPVVGVHPDGDAFNYKADGGFYADHVDSVTGWDLVSEYVEPPKPREVWFHMGNIGPGGLYSEMDRDYLLANNPDCAAKLVKFREVIEA
jgi:hypothetical protein